MASPTSEPGPVTRLKTPAGRSASARQPARTVAHSDVLEAGFQTTVLPAARAGAMSSPGIVYGQFQGVMTPDHAARHAIGEDAFVGVDRRRHQAIEPGRLGGGHAEVDDELLDLAVRLGHQRLALVERQRPRQLVAPRLDGAGHAFHGRGSLEGRPPRPAGEGIGGGGHGAFDVAAASLARWSR